MRRRVLIVVVTVLVLLAGGVAAGAAWWRWDTGRQPQVRDAVAAMTRAVADAVTAAGPSVAVAVSGVVRSTDCEINLLRGGGIFTAGADLYTRPGEEEDVVTAMAQALSGAYAVRRGVAVSGFRPLEADLPPGVRLSVRRLSQGRLGVSARTGCSLGSAPAPADDPMDPAARDAVTALFTSLGTRPASFTTHRLPCAQGSISTVAAVSEPADTTDLSARLSAVVPASAGLFDPGDANLVVYREGPVSVVIAASDDGTSVTGQYTVAC
jgi:hypothetical protein